MFLNCVQIAVSCKTYKKINANVRINLKKCRKTKFLVWNLLFQEGVGRKEHTEEIHINFFSASLGKIGRLECVCVIYLRGNGIDRINWVQICSDSVEERVLVNTVNFHIIYNLGIS